MLNLSLTPFSKVHSVFLIFSASEMSAVSVRYAGGMYLCLPVIDKSAERAPT